MFPSAPLQAPSFAGRWPLAPSSSFTRAAGSVVGEVEIWIDGCGTASRIWPKTLRLRFGFSGCRVCAPTRRFSSSPEYYVRTERYHAEKDTSRGSILFEPA
ncbi:hypothetical protein PM082_015403 [Marasmius tenuissimus]|nr:hypothetical protein PM082_015403 [Marasmius tenuissimus]